MAFLGPLFPAALPATNATVATAGRLAAVTAPLPAALGNMASGVRVAGIVMALQGDGKQQIRTQQGAITLTPRTPLPTGARVVAELAGTPARPQVKLVSLTPPPAANTPAPSPAAGAAPTPAPAVAAAPLSHHWPGLDKLLSQAAAGGTKQHAALSAALPHTGAGLTRGLIAFIAALRAGQLEQLLGRSLALSLLKHPRLGPLANALGQDMAQLQRFAFDPGPGAWHGLFAPLIVGDQLHQLRFFILRKGAPEEGEIEPRTRRFIVETELQALGPIQLDGLLGERRLDLVLRSAAALPKAWQNELAAAVSQTTAVAGIVGKLAFQTCRSFPVKPLEDGLLGNDAQGVMA